jgi:hypothetical protein
MFRPAPARNFMNFCSNSFDLVIFPKLNTNLSLNPITPQLTFVSLLGGGGVSIK